MKAICLLLLFAIFASMACNRPSSTSPEGGKSSATANPNQEAPTEGSLAGNWAGKNGAAIMTWTLAEDGTCVMIAGDEAHYSISEGKYSVADKSITLDLTGPSVATKLTYTFTWDGPNAIGVALAQQTGLTQKLTRAGAVLTTATVDTVVAAQTGQTVEDMHKKADEVLCLANLKQLGLAMKMFTQDNGTFPPADQWAAKLQPYVKNETYFTCPALAKLKQQGGYAMNSELSQIDPNTVASPETTVLLFESDPAANSGPTNTTALSTPRHVKVGYVFADGHAEFR